MIRLLKNKIYIIFVFAVTVICSSYSQWTQFTINPGFGIGTISAIDNNNVFAWGSNLFKTSNGGSNWINAGRSGIANGISIISIFAINQDTIIASGYNSTPSQTCYAFRTTNGGTNWNQVYFQNGGWINGLAMKDNINGIMVGDPVAGLWTILRTTNAGLSWIPAGTMSPVSGEEGMINSLFVRGDNIWFGTISHTSVYYSSDFGTTWNRQVLPSSGGTYSLYFANELTGISAGPFNVNYTTNAGVNWTALPYPSAGLFPMGVAGNSSFLLVGKREGQVFKTTNLGISWELDFVPSDGSLRHSMTSSRTGNRIWDTNHNGIVRRRDGPLNVQQISHNVPTEFKLEQNYPNPFNPETKIRFDISESSNLKLGIYNVQGKLISLLLDGKLSAGSYVYSFSAGNLPSGVYFYKLEAENFSEVRKMMLVK